MKYRIKKKYSHLTAPEYFPQYKPYFVWNYFYDYSVGDVWLAPKVSFSTKEKAKEFLSKIKRGE